MGLAVLAIFGVGVAVDRPARLAAGGDVDLRRLAGAGKIVVAGVDLHFGERQRPLRAGKLDADEPADRPRFHGGRSRQAVDKRENAVIEARAHARVAHQRQGLDHVNEPARLRLGQLPYLRARIAAAEGVDRRQRDIANPAQLRPPGGGRHPLHVAPQLGQLAGGPREQHPDQIEHGGRIDGPLAGVELAQGVDGNADDALGVGRGKPLDRFLTEPFVEPCSQQHLAEHHRRSRLGGQLVVGERPVEEPSAGVGREGDQLLRLAGRAELRLEDAGRFLLDVIHVPIGREVARHSEGLDRGRVLQIARRADRLEADARAVVTGAAHDPLEGLWHPIGNSRHDAHRGSPRTGVGAGQDLLEKRQRHLIEVTQRPQPFEPIVLEGRRLRIELCDPGRHRRHDFRLGAAVELELGPVADPVDRIGEELDELGNRAAANRHRLGHRLAIHHHPVDAAVDPVAAGVAEVVLHVTDDRVLPIGEVDGAVGPHLEIGRAEVRVARRDDRLDLGRLGIAAVPLGELVLEDSLEADHVADEEIPLELGREVGAGEELDPRAGAGALVVNTRGATMLVHPIESRREDRAPVGNGACAVDDDVIAPGIEGVAVRVGEAIGGVEAELPCPRLILEDRAVGDAHRGAPRRFPLGMVEGPFLEVDRPRRIERKAIGGVVGVGSVEAADDPRLDVVIVVAVGVLEIKDVGALRDDHALPPELKAGRVVEITGKGLDLVGAAVAVGVLENQQLVVHRLVGPPVRIGWPSGDPQPPLCVEGHLHRIDQFREHLLVGDELDLHPGVDRHLPNRILAREELMLAAGERARLVGDHRNELREARFFDLGKRGVGIAEGGGRGPDPLVAVGGHDVEVIELALADFVVRLIFDKLQPRPAAVGGVAVGDAVAVEPVEVLVGDGFLEAVETLGIAGRRGAKQRFVDDPGDLAIAAGSRVDAVAGERLLDLLAGFARRGEEVDIGHPLRLADLLHRLGIEGDVGVVGLAVGPVSPVEILMDDRREHHHTRRGDAVVFLAKGVLEELLDLGLEGLQAGGAGVGFVGPKEGEDHVGAGVGELEAVFADEVLRLQAARIGDRRGAGEPLIGCAEIGRAEPLGGIDLVAVVSEVADHESLVREAGVEQCLEPAGVLHGVGNAAADDAEVVSFADLEPAGGLGRGGEERRYQQENCNHTNQCRHHRCSIRSSRKDWRGDGNRTTSDSQQDVRRSVPVTSAGACIRQHRGTPSARAYQPALPACCFGGGWCVHRSGPPESIFAPCRRRSRASRASR